MSIYKSFFLLLSFSLFLAAADSRIVRAVDNSRRTVMRGHVHPSAQTANDQGLAPAGMAMSDLTILMKPGPGLEQLLTEQRVPGSSNYHRWLTPEQFGDRFGLSGSDVAKVTRWLESQGLHVDQVARGRHWVTFSGTAANVARAFGTEIHRYRVQGETHFGNSTELSVPTALADVVAGFDGFNDLNIQPARRMVPAYTVSGSHFLAPGDFATIYNIAPLYASGIDGTGQKIVVVGQSGINPSDIQAFRKRFNLPANDPQILLGGTNPGVTASDMGEADLDIEWTGAIAPKASIIYVYATSATTAAKFAIDQNLAPVISESFVFCEQSLSPAQRYLAQQANAQGITWLAGSGDWGAATCDAFAATPQASKGLTIGMPASIPEVTGIGGTMFNEGSGTYWGTANDAGLASALSYIPETSWNDLTASDQLFGKSGGGASTVFAKPLWQTGPGVPSDNARDIPDISITAGASHDGYVLVTGGTVFVAGGTSAGTPAFAGVVALLNQYLTANGAISQPGLGNINPALYRLAQSASDVFHDIADGDNRVTCMQGSPSCVNGYLGYGAGPGYDLVTGLGSIDVAKLAAKWSSGTPSTLSLSATPGTVNATDTVVLTAAVSGSGATPTGAVSFLANDTLLGTATLAAATGGATATLNVPAYRIVSGSGQVSAVYDGNAVYSPSAATTSVSLNVNPAAALVVPNITPASTPPVATALGPLWLITVTLTEKAGVAAKLTGLTFGGNDVSSQIPALFLSNNIPANGVLSTVLQLTPSAAPPLTAVFGFSGTDTNGKAWSSQASVTLLPAAGPLSFPAMTLGSPTPSVVRNPQADPSCQWPQLLTVQETNGYTVVLTRLTVDGTNYTNQIQTIFGTTRLAPYGLLQGTMCWSGVNAPATKNYVLSGTAEGGTAIQATLSANFAPAPTGATSTLATTQPSIGISGSGSTPLGIQLGGSTATWRIAPLQPAAWLKLSQSSGSGDGQVMLTTSSSGLSNGAYRAVLAIQCDSAVPQVVTVPVTMVVGASSSASIGGVANNFSGSTTVSPGTMLAVFGSGLAPAGTAALAQSLPLPLSLAGVSATVNGISAPLYYVSPVQLDVQIPYEAGAGPAVLAVSNNGDVSTFLFNIALTAPGMAQTAGNLIVVDPVAGGYPTSLKQGKIYTMFITGEGDVTPSLATGATPPAGTAVANLPQPRLPLTVSIGGAPATVNFVGIPSGLAGVTQINFTVPQNAAVGVQQVVVTVGGISSPAANVTVTQ